ncbi:MAG: glycosyltransferase family 39 protein [Flavobacteriales bacterium]|nr:glycosyltransferase family 39 protein [Flavobacteriales bacterium]
MESKKSDTFNYVFFFVGITPLLLWMWHHVHQDAWWDELISLKDYALVSFETTRTSYPEPGNHIFFNLFDNVVSRLIGVRDFYEMLDNLWKLRLAQGLLAIGTCIYAFLTVKRFFSERYASLAVIFLASSIPFLNFSLQLRGYNMSMLFVSMILYHGWSYLDSRKWPHLVIIGLTSFFLLYTIPSNVYFLFGLCAVIGIDWLVQFRAQNKPVEDKKGKKKKGNGVSFFSFPHLWILGAVGVGAGITFVAYQPVMEQLLDNRFVSVTPQDRAFVLTTVFPSVMKAFFSFRWLLMLPVLGGLFFWLTKKELDFNRKHLVYLLVIFVLPFVFLLMHNKVPFERTFVHLAPVFAILLAAITALFIDGLKFNETVKRTVVAVLAMFCLGNSVWQNLEINDHLDKNLERNKREQNMYHAFFLADNFQPNNSVNEFLALQDTNAAVILVDELDRVSYLYYLEKNDINSYAMIKIRQQKVEMQGRTFSHLGMYQRSNGKGEKVLFQQIPANLGENNKAYNNYLLLVNIVEQIEPGKNIYLFTGFPNKAEKAIEMFFKDRYDLKRLNDPNFANLYLLERKSAPTGL